MAPQPGFLRARVWEHHRALEVRLLPTVLRSGPGTREDYVDSWKVPAMHLALQFEELLPVSAQSPGSCLIFCCLVDVVLGFCGTATHGWKLEPIFCLHLAVF